MHGAHYDQTVCAMELEIHDISQVSRRYEKYWQTGVQYWQVVTRVAWAVKTRQSWQTDLLQYVLVCLPYTGLLAKVL